MSITEHNYNLKLLRMDAAGKLAFLRKSGRSSWYCRISHGKRCRVFQGGWCNCDPDIEFVKDKARAGDFLKSAPGGKNA